MSTLIERQPSYQPTSESCTIKVDMPPCIGCGLTIYQNTTGMLTLEEVFSKLLCDKCRGTLQAFRFLAEPSLNACTCASPEDRSGGFVRVVPHAEGCPARSQACLPYCGAQKAPYDVQHVPGCPNYHLWRR